VAARAAPWPFRLQLDGGSAWRRQPAGIPDAGLGRLSSWIAWRKTGPCASGCLAAEKLMPRQGLMGFRGGRDRTRQGRWRRPPAPRDRAVCGGYSAQVEASHSGPAWRAAAACSASARAVSLSPWREQQGAEVQLRREASARRGRGRALARSGLMACSGGRGASFGHAGARQQFVALQDWAARDIGQPVRPAAS